MAEWHDQPERRRLGLHLSRTRLPTTDPRFRGCTPDSPGPFVAFVPDPANYADQQQYSLFGELQIPVLDNLNFQAAVRREEFSGGLGATVYKVAGKWDVWGPLSFRASYGTNYQAPPVGVDSGCAGRCCAHLHCRGRQLAWRNVRHRRQHQAGNCNRDERSAPSGTARALRLTMNSA